MLAACALLAVAAWAGAAEPTSAGERRHLGGNSTPRAAPAPATDPSDAPSPEAAVRLARCMLPERVWTKMSEGFVAGFERDIEAEREQGHFMAQDVRDELIRDVRALALTYDEETAIFATILARHLREPELDDVLAFCARRRKDESPQTALAPEVLSRVERAWREAGQELTAIEGRRIDDLISRKWKSRLPP